jgi:iron complex transport system ATP-binding protein
MKISVSNVAASYSSGPPVLRNVTFEALPGKVVVLIGPNAAGKSTLLKILAGLMRPSEGHVEIGGKNLAGMCPSERANSVAWVGQQANFSGHFTVQDVVAMGRYALAAEPSVVAEAIEATALDSLAHRVVEELSVGQQQRVALARAIAQIPGRGVLVLDEPFAALDPNQVERAARLVRRRAAEGTAVVVAVHDVRLASILGDDVIGLRDGEIVACGPMSEALNSDAIERIYSIPSVVGPEGPLPALRL